MVIDLQSMIIRRSSLYDEDECVTIQAAQRQINDIIAGCTTASSIKEFTACTKGKYDDAFLFPKHINCAVQPSPSCTYVHKE